MSTAPDFWATCRQIASVLGGVRTPEAVEFRANVLTELLAVEMSYSPAAQDRRNVQVLAMAVYAKLADYRNASAELDKVGGVS